MSEFKTGDSAYPGCEIEEKNPGKRLFKRLGRKLTFWYVHPFGENQNKQNEQVNKNLASLNLQDEAKSKEIAMLKQEVDALLSSQRALTTELNTVKLRSTLNSNQIQKVQSNLDISDRKIDEYLVELKPEIRKGVCADNKKELFGYGYSGLGEKITELKNAGADPNTVKTILEDISLCYIKGAKNEIQQIDIRTRRSTVAVICVGLKDSLGIEAIRNEAYDIYNMLRTKSIYNAKMVSIEKDIKEAYEENSILYIPAEKVYESVAKLNPKLCIICESTAGVLTWFHCGLLMFRSIIKLSAQNPVTNLSENSLAELRHLNDFGMHKYCVYSKTAYDTMVEKGFKEPIISYPIINTEKSVFKTPKKALDVNSPVIGFASSPMLEEQSEARGMMLLCELAIKLPRFKFKILWRSQSCPAPELLLSAENCEIVYGKYDMDKFYSEIDLLLVPYASKDYNHACSMSAIEAMYNRIPVVCTKVSGISEIVDFCKNGKVSDENAYALAQACRSAIDDYDSITTDKCYSDFTSFLNNLGLLRLVEAEMQYDLPKGIVTIYEWDRFLRLENKYLVKGIDNMKDYYRSEEVAGKYNATRFETYPQNCFDLLERKSINVIIEDYFSKNGLSILDIACGDGRILQEDLRYGKCTAADSSDAMLTIVRDKFADKKDSLKTIQCDFFNNDIDDTFDVVTTFRYIRHFEYAQRKHLYGRIKKVLKPHGLLIFDVPNLTFELNQKTTNGWGKYNIYDVFWLKNAFIDEMHENGFEVKYLIPVGQGLIDSEISKSEPMTWTAAVSKIEK